MDYSRYLRSKAAEFNNFGITVRDPIAAQSFYELAMLCEERAAKMDGNAKSDAEASHFIST